MALTRPVIIPPWAETGDKSAQPSDSEIQGGWPLTTTPPSRQKFNWLLNFLANAVRYLVNRGVADWSSSETYGVGAVVIGNDNKLYRSLKASNSNKQPSTQSDWWSIFTESADLWDRLTANGIDANLGVTNHLPNINVDPFLIPEGYFDVSTSGDKPFAYGICRTRKEDNTVVYQFAQSSTNGDFATRMYRESIGDWTAWKYYANLSGSTAEFFNVKTATSDDHAPTFKQLTDGLATKAAKAGDSSQKFSAADGATGKEVVNYDQLLAGAIQPGGVIRSVYAEATGVALSSTPADIVTATISCTSGQPIKLRITAKIPFNLDNSNDSSAVFVLRNVTDSANIDTSYHWDRDMINSGMSGISVLQREITLTPSTTTTQFKATGSIAGSTTGTAGKTISGVASYCTLLVEVVKT